MVRSKLGLKALGLCILALGLMAVSSASVAQAEPTSFWSYINSKGELVKFNHLEPEITGELEKLLKSPFELHAVLLTTILKKAVEILCTSFTAEGKLKLEGKVLGTLTFHGCIIKVGGITQAACEPHEGASKGLIQTLLIDGLIRLHELAGVKDETVEFKPHTGQNAFAHVKTSELCSIGEDILIGGKFSTKDSQNEFLVHKTSHLIEEFPALTELWALSNTPEHKATIDGSALVSLKGVGHVGLKWAGTPG